MKEPLVDSVEGNMINTSTCMILDLDLTTMRKEEVEFSNLYSLRVQRDDKVHALVAWFDVRLSRRQHDQHQHLHDIGLGSDDDEEGRGGVLELVLTQGAEDDKVHALVAWFDVQFSKLQNPVTLSTSPYKKYTHWKQTVFYLDHDLQVAEGDWIKGSIAVRQSKVNFRELDVKISYHIEGHFEKKDFVQMYKLR
eukprot:CAMPEP_0202977606 /NCGR_PEP_ID=MMETSP1396-20130829/84347_1 /ASSEMBLY_ACC=CAM_ASM_000872 /TAXON_ID= /ORGANISM="Pseudokeronopsis sp., Strain Brazil" /LENGTH=193 /DNA_ID=CAMNT_0049716381 /DNA_START=727 /DNA_END=1309 /DNA_ORIENTATION=+